MACMLSSVRPLEAAAAVGQHQGVAPAPAAAASSGWIGVRFVDHACVVEQQRAPGLGQREAQALRAAGVEDPRLAALDVARPPGSPPPGRRRRGARLRASGGRCRRCSRCERGAPRRTSAAGAAQRAGQCRPAPPAGAAKAGSARQRGGQRLEPALDAAVQGVVFHRLPVRPVRHRLRPAGPRRRSSRGGGAGSGRRRAGAGRAAGRPTTLAQRAASSRPAPPAGPATGRPARRSRRLPAGPVQVCQGGQGGCRTHGVPSGCRPRGFALRAARRAHGLECALQSRVSLLPAWGVRVSP